MTSKEEVKRCSRGHKYKGAGGCPICWSGNKSRSFKVTGKY